MPFDKFVMSIFVVFSLEIIKFPIISYTFTSISCVLFNMSVTGLGYINNSSLQNMKWYWKDVKWVATFKHQKIISLSGIHPFLEMQLNLNAIYMI